MTEPPDKQEESSDAGRLWHRLNGWYGRLSEEDQREFWKGIEGTFGMAVFGLAYALFVVVRVVAYGLHDPTARNLILIGMLLFAVIYYFTQQTRWILLVGIIEVVASLISNHIQLGKLAAAPATVYDRLVLIIGGVLLMGKGVKDTVEGAKKF